MTSPKKPWVTPAVWSSSALSQTKRARIVELHEEHLDARTIAERLGIHRNTVMLWLRRMGLNPERHCACGRRLRGLNERCFACRGYRPSVRAKRPRGVRALSHIKPPG